MPLTPTEVTAVANAETAKFGYVSLHTGNPGTTGANEVTGGSYARKPSAFTLVNGVLTTVPLFDAPAGTYTHFGLWSAATGGTFYGGNPVAEPATISPAGQVRVTVGFPVTTS